MTTATDTLAWFRHYIDCVSRDPNIYDDDVHELLEKFTELDTSLARGDSLPPAWNRVFPATADHTPAGHTGPLTATPGPTAPASGRTGDSDRHTGCPCHMTCADQDATQKGEAR